MKDLCNSYESAANTEKPFKYVLLKFLSQRETFLGLLRFSSRLFTDDYFINEM